jgi:cyclin-dependent kinase 2
VPHTLCREIDGLVSLKSHPNIVKCFDVFERKGRSFKSELLMTFEFFEDGDLDKYYRRRYPTGLPVDQVIDFAE